MFLEKKNIHHFSLAAGDSETTGGSVKLQSGPGALSGDVASASASGSNASGRITLSPGAASAGTSGAIRVASGSATVYKFTKKPALLLDPLQAAASVAGAHDVLVIQMNVAMTLLLLQSRQNLLYMLRSQFARKACPSPVTVSKSN